MGLTMGPEPDVLTATIDELIATFRSAVVAMIPYADMSKLAWRDGEEHPDWERLVVRLFDTFVRGPAQLDRTRRLGDFALAKFDIDLESYANCSWIGICTDSGTTEVVVRLMSVDGPFDTVRTAHVEAGSGKVVAHGTVPWANARFLYARRSVDGSVETLQTIVADG